MDANKVLARFRACKEFCVSDRTIVFESKLVKKYPSGQPRIAGAHLR